MRKRMKLWLAFFAYNLGFEFRQVSSGGWMRCGFNDEINGTPINSFSWRGTQLDHPQISNPSITPITMNIQPSRFAHSLEEADATMMHELGHLIGVSHEHLNWVDGPKFNSNSHLSPIPEDQRSQYVATKYGETHIMGYHVTCSITEDQKKCGFFNREILIAELKEWIYHLNVIDEYKNASRLIDSSQWKLIYSEINDQINNEVT